jgi:hypothetical protein
LAAFAIKINNVNSLKINETYMEWIFEDSCSVALRFGLLWLGWRPGSIGFHNLFGLSEKDIVGY